MRVYTLTPDEEREYRHRLWDIEGQVDKMYGLYASALAAICAWVLSQPNRDLFLGTSTSPLPSIILIGLATANAAFTSVVVYRSLSIHELAKFIIYHADLPTASLAWESWRRSIGSPTRPVRPLYATMLAFLPFMVGIILLVIAAPLTFSLPRSSMFGEQTRLAFYVAILFYCIPLYFLWHAARDGERWKLLLERANQERGQANK